MTSDESLQPPEASAGGSRRLLQLLMPGVGAVLLIAGIVFLAWGPGTGTLNYAWVAYTPEGGVAEDALLISRSMQAGSLLLLAGAAVLAFWGGLQAGRRRRRPAPPASSTSNGDGQSA